MVNLDKQTDVSLTLCPGDYIVDAIEEQGWEISDLAFSLGISEGDLYDYIDGEMSITPRLAVKLTAVLGYTPNFWLEVEKNYTEDLLETCQLTTNSSP